MSNPQLPRLAKDRLSRYLSRVPMRQIRKPTTPTTIEHNYRNHAIVEYKTKREHHYTVKLGGLTARANTLDIAKSLVDEAMDGAKLF